MTHQPGERTSRPNSRTDLFLSFSILALQGFGGVLAIVQRELVERRRWMTREQFVEEWAVAQVMPGPNVVNLSLMIGGRYFGLSGALAALAGMLAAPLVVVLMLAFFYGKVADTSWAQAALRGMGMVSAGLIAATGIKLMGALASNAMGWRMCTFLAAATFIAIAWLRLPLVWVLLGLGGIGFAWAFRCLRMVPTNPQKDLTP
ncbi:MAG: chromate transporter [Burkholderiales bacterium]|nr:chromate transporter [Burkholderiales bacterium]